VGYEFTFPTIEGAEALLFHLHQSAFHMGQPPVVCHVGMQAQDYPYVALPLLSCDRISTFDMKDILVHFVKMLDDTNWEKCILSPPLKESCFVLPR
jgi:hypothetical protein